MSESLTAVAVTGVAYWVQWNGTNDDEILALFPSDVPLVAIEGDPKTLVVDWGYRRTFDIGSWIGVNVDNDGNVLGANTAFHDGTTFRAANAPVNPWPPD